VGDRGGDARLQLRALGPLDALRDGEAVPLGGGRQRLVLAALVCACDRSLTTDQLIHAVWGDDVPPAAVGSLQAYLSRLRRLLGKELIVRDVAGYRFRVPPPDVDLAPVADPNAVARPLALALKVPYRAGEAVLTRYAERLGGHPTLVVLDNAEHQLDAIAAHVTELLSRCPELRVLVTSQVPLAVERETLVPLAPLPVEGSASLELFVDGARAVVPGSQVTAVNRPAIDEILRRVDGLPLASELAAATLDLLTPRLLAERLADDLGALQRSDPADARHATLRATLDWSYELLAEPELRLLERLAVFAGRCGPATSSRRSAPGTSNTCATSSLWRPLTFTTPSRSMPSRGYARWTPTWGLRWPRPPIAATGTGSWPSSTMDPTWRRPGRGWHGRWSAWRRAATGSCSPTRS
jgi:hypothetical protein